MSLKNLFKEEQISNLLPVAICLFFLSDLFKKFFYRYIQVIPGHVGISSIIKGVFFAYCAILFIKLYSEGKIRVKHVVLFATWVMIVVIGQGTFIYNNFDSYSLQGVVAYFLKYSFPIVLSLCFAVIFKAKRINKKIIRSLDLFFILNSVLIIIGYIFDIHWFSTYGNNRVGYSGYIEAQNEVALFSLIGLFYFDHQASKIHLYRYYLGVFLISMLFTGNKATYLTVVIYCLVLVYYALIKGTFLNKIKWFHVLLILILPFLTLYVMKDALIFHINLYKSTDLLTTITSTRNILFKEQWIPEVMNWNVFNFLFGGGDFSRIYIEMDLFDLILYCGVLGSILFLWIYFKTIFNFSKNNIKAWIFATAFFLIGSLSGHFFASGVNVLYLVVLSQLFKEKQINNIL